MKTLELKNTSYIYLEQSFREWLNIIGYAETTVNSWPNHVREFLHYLEQHNVNQITQVTPHRTYNFINYIKNRKSKITGTGLSTNSINKIKLPIKTSASMIKLPLLMWGLRGQTPPQHVRVQGPKTKSL